MRREPALEVRALRRHSLSVPSTRHRDAAPAQDRTVGEARAGLRQVANHPDPAVASPPAYLTSPPYGRVRAKHRVRARIAAIPMSVKRTAPFVAPALPNATSPGSVRIGSMMLRVGLAGLAGSSSMKPIGRRARHGHDMTPQWTFFMIALVRAVWSPTPPRGPRSGSGSSGSSGRSRQADGRHDGDDHHRYQQLEQREPRFGAGLPWLLRHTLWRIPPPYRASGNRRLEG